MFYSDELLSRHSVISTHGFCTNTSSESDGDSLNTRADAVQCNIVTRLTLGDAVLN